MRIPGTALALFGVVVVALAQVPHASAADFSAIWDGGTGNWDDPLHWNTNPNYPNNSGGVTYDATINSGTVTLDRNIAIQRLFLNGATTSSAVLSGPFELTLNDGLSWSGGRIGLTTINLVAGSASTISGFSYTKILNGTINNFGTVNDYGGILLFDGAITNAAGATWTLRQSTALNSNGMGMLAPPPAGTFNNAGDLVLVGGGNSLNAYFYTTLINTGTVTLQSPASGVSNFYVHSGSATGVFDVGSQTQLQFGNYSLATGATISGAGVTNIVGSLDILGNANINSSLVNTGILLVESGATLTLNGPFTHGPATSSSALAITRLNGGTIVSSQTLAFAHGILAGRGTINANVDLSASTLSFRLGGTTPGGGVNNYDSINVNGGTMLGGKLGIFFKNGFESSIASADTFSVFHSSSGLTGTFDDVANGSRIDTGDYLGSFVVNYQTNGISLSNFVPNTRWLGGSGNWTDATHWLSNPLYPNDTTTTHYSALIRDGSVFLDSNITVSRFFLTGGTLTCGSALTVTNGFGWTGGTISGGGTVLAAGSVSTISRPLDGTVTTRRLNNGVLNNYGTVNQTAEISNLNSAVSNMAGATWNIDATQVQSFSSNIFFNNLGTLTIRGPVNDFGFLVNNGSVIVQDGSTLTDNQRGGSGNGSFFIGTGASMTLGPYTFNAGSTITGSGTATLGAISVAGDTTMNCNVVINADLTVQPGITLTLGGPFTQHIGTTYLKNATITSTQLLNFELGKLMGSGTINGNASVGSNTPNPFYNSIVTPGDQANAIGTFTINGSLSLLNLARIVLDIAGGNSPANDKIVVSGAASLDGILELHVSLTQFNPKETFTLLTSSDLAGVFDNVANGARLTSADGTTSFQVNYGTGSPYGANNLVLSDPEPVPEPTSIILLAGGALALTLLRVRRR